MTLSAIEKLNKWEKAFSTGNTSEVEEMLAEDYVFENTDGNHETKNEVLSWVSEGGHSIGDFKVYHEDESTICGRHSYKQDGEPEWEVMFFARFENNKCKFWKVHGGVKN